MSTAVLSLPEAEAFNSSACTVAAQRWREGGAAHRSAMSATRFAIDRSAAGWNGVAAAAFRTQAGSLGEDVKAVGERWERMAQITDWYANAMGQACAQAVDAARQAREQGFLVTADWAVRPSPAQLASLAIGFNLIAAHLWQQRITMCVGIIQRVDDQATQAAEDPQAGLPGKPPHVGKHNYVLGPPYKRQIKHDDDFPFESQKGTSTLRDELSWVAWEGILRGAQASRVDLDDALPLYEHFRGASGDPVGIDYEEAYREDKRIRSAVDLEIADAMAAADRALRDGHRDFQMQSPLRGLGVQPATDNWRKTLGGHTFWSESEVTVTGDTATMVVKVKVEDRWNFNEGQHDVSAGLADRENGRFEELGWARSFLTHGELERTVSWRVGSPHGLIPDGPEAPGGLQRGEPVGGGRDEGGWREDREDPSNTSRWVAPTNAKGSWEIPEWER